LATSVTRSTLAPAHHALRLDHRAFGGTLSAALVAAALVATPLCAAATPSQTEIAVCPNVTQTTYPEAGVGGIGPATFGCEAAAHSAGFVFVQPDGTCTTPTNTSLGTFVTTQKPLGMWISVGSPNSCATNPPTLGFGAVGGRVTVNAAQAGFCPTSLTIPAVIGDHAAVVFPIGNLPLGSYSVTATFPDQAVLNPMDAAVVELDREPSDGNAPRRLDLQGD
jgi:hypothetical protein